MSTPLAELNLAEMSLANLQSLAVEKFREANEIEEKYTPLSPDTHPTEYAESKRLLGECDVVEDRLRNLEEAEARKARITQRLADYTRPATVHPQPASRDQDWERPESPGDQFVKSAEFQALLSSGLLNNPRNQVPHIVVPMQKSPLFGSVAAGNPDILAFKDYLRRVIEIKSTAGTLVAEQKDVIADLKRASERPKVFTF